MSSENGINRRELVKKGAAVSAVSTTGFVGMGTAAEDDASVDLESLLHTEEVRAIERAVPTLNLQPQKATAFGNGESVNRAPSTGRGRVPDRAPAKGLDRVRNAVRRLRNGGTHDRDTGTGGEFGTVSIPANHGTLIVVAADGERTVLFDFDKRLPQLDFDWPEGTRARLKATDGDVVFQRTATDAETRRALEAIDGSEPAGSDGTHVSVAPEEGEFYVTDVDQDAGHIEAVRLESRSGARTTAAGDAGLQIVERERFEPGSDVSIQSHCDCGDTAGDIILCVYGFWSCGGCFIGWPAPPIMVACMLAVCIGSGGALMSLLADAGCSDLQGCAGYCYDKCGSNLSCWDS